MRNDAPTSCPGERSAGERLRGGLCTLRADDFIHAGIMGELGLTAGGELREFLTLYGGIELLRTVPLLDVYEREPGVWWQRPMQLRAEIAQLTGCYVRESSIRIWTV
jgi:hypothetical protein